MTTTQETAESFLAIRRADGEPMYDEYSWTSAGPDDDPWSAAKDFDDEEPTEYELIRVSIDPIEKRTVGGPRPVCASYNGNEIPFMSAWRIFIPPSGDPDVWPASGHPVPLTFSDTELEARTILAELPDTFFVHHVGAHYSAVEKSSLYIERQEQAAFVPACRDCGHPKAAHHG